MALTERRAEPREIAPVAPPRGFRPTSRRRARFAAGAVLAAVGIGGNVLLYSSLDDSTDVVQVVGTIRQGEQIEAADLRVVSLQVDETVPVVPAGRLGSLVGQYARTYIASGTLIVDVMVQPTPLVAAGQGVVALEIRPTRVPRDLRERSRVFVVVVPDDDEVPLFVTTGRVVARTDADSGGVLSLSVELSEADAPTVAAADDVRVVLLDPGVDPVTEAVSETLTETVDDAPAAPGSVPSTISPSTISPSTISPSTISPSTISRDTGG